MKTGLRIIGGLGAFVLVVVVGFVVFVSARGVPSYAPPQPAVAAIEATPARIELGEKLVLASCGDCHRNAETNVYSGQLLSDLPPGFGRVYAANITQDRVHGIGTWTDAELVGILRTGIGRDGRFRVIMPHFALTSDEDIASIVAFLRSGSPQVRATPAATPKQGPSFLLKALTNTVMKPSPLPTAAIVAPAPTDAVPYGRYLVVGRYKCFECHSKAFDSNNTMQPELSAGYLGGGNKMQNPRGQVVVSRNITGDTATGIGHWTEEQFGQAVRFGTAPHGPLGAPMPKYSRLDDAEVHALFAYLQSVPKLKTTTSTDGAVAVK